MLELEAPRHTRLRGLVLRAFTSRTIAALGPDIRALCHAMIDAFPSTPFDLLTAYAQPVPVRIIAKLLGVPEDQSDNLLRWSNAMVAMYQAKRSPRSRPTPSPPLSPLAPSSAIISTQTQNARKRPDLHADRGQ